MTTEIEVLEYQVDCAFYAHEDARDNLDAAHDDGDFDAIESALDSGVSPEEYQAVCAEMLEGAREATRDEVLEAEAMGWLLRVEEDPAARRGR